MHELDFDDLQLDSALSLPPLSPHDLPEPQERKLSVANAFVIDRSAPTRLDPSK